MIKFAIAGAGYIANIHAAAIHTLAEAELVAVVDRFPKTAAKLQKKYQVNKYYATVDDLVQNTSIDALVICTPNYLHFPQTISALKAGVHVMVEKPMAMNAAEAYQMLETSQNSGALLMVAHCWRFDPEVLWLYQQASSGSLGRVIRTKGYGVHQKWGPSGWFTEARFAGGGAMADLGIHALDTARFLLGDPQPDSVYARIGTYYKDFEVDDTGIIIVNWKSGTTSYIESGWWQPHADGPEATTQLYGTLGFGQLFPTYIKDQNQVQNPGFIHPRVEHCPQSLYNDQMANFIQCIQADRIPSPGGVEGWINMKVVDAAYESARTGKVISVD